MTVATIKSGDVHIPEEMLRKYGLGDGARVALEDTLEGIVIHPPKSNGTISDANENVAARQALEKAVGFMGGDGSGLKALLEERRKERRS